MAIEDIISRLIADIEKQKEDLMLQKLAEKVNLDKDFDIKAEALSRFPRLRVFCNKDLGEEHWYWNNGTFEGLRIISFYKDDTVTPIEMGGKINIGLRYN
jgi:hypothetical protein